MRDLNERLAALDRFITRRRVIVEGLQATIEKSQIDSERRLSLIEGVFDNYVHLALCQYSLGWDSDSVRIDLRKAIEWFSEVNLNYLEHLSLERYWDYLSFFSLLRLLEPDIVVISCWKHWSDFDLEDRLIRFIVKGDCGEDAQLLHGDAYMPIVPLVSCASERECKKILKQYLMGWYKRHKRCHWHNGHTKKGPAYFGYWSVESAAVMKVKGIECSDISSDYFPGDLLIPNFKGTGVLPDQNLRQTISYPGFDSVSLTVPNAWINESRERLGIISVDTKLEIAGTVYSADRKSLEEFAKTKEVAMMKNMPWYEQVQRISRFNEWKGAAYFSGYEGVWPNESRPTYCLVVFYQLQSGQFLSISFTCLSEDFENFRGEIVNIMKSVQSN